jgi:hypothetical protein
MEIEPPDPSIMLNSFLCIQKEIFVNICAHFSKNVCTSNQGVYKRALDFSTDFNNCEPFDFQSLMLSDENFPLFCNFMFDFINYIRKIDQNLYNESLGFAREQMKFPSMPTLDMAIVGCGNSITMFLDMRENGLLPKKEDFE